MNGRQVLEILLERTVLALLDGKGCAVGIVLGTEARGMDLIDVVEHVLGLPMSELLQTRSAYALEVDPRHIHLFGHGLSPRGERVPFAGDGGLVVPRVAGRQRSDERISALGTHVVDEHAHILSVAIDGFDATIPVLRATIVERHGDAGIGVDASDAVACGPGVKGTIVVVTQFDEHVVASLHALEHIGPKLVVERAARRAAEGMVLDGDALFVKILIGKGTPAPLAVVAIALGAGAHRAVADEEENGIVALAAGAGNGACIFRIGILRLLVVIDCGVVDAVYVLHLSSTNKGGREKGERDEGSFHRSVCLLLFFQDFLDYLEGLEIIISFRLAWSYRQRGSCSNGRFQCRRDERGQIR